MGPSPSTDTAEGKKVLRTPLGGLFSSTAAWRASRKHWRPPLLASGMHQCRHCGFIVIFSNSSCEVNVQPELRTTEAKSFFFFLKQAQEGHGCPGLCGGSGTRRRETRGKPFMKWLSCARCFYVHAETLVPQRCVIPLLKAPCALACVLSG